MVGKVMVDFRKLLFLVTFLGFLLVVVRLFLRRTVRTAKLRRWWRLIADRFHEYQFLKVPEFNDNFQENQLYRRLTLYVNSLESLEDSNLTNLFAGTKSNEIVLSLNPNQTIEDTFLSARVWWTNEVSRNDCVGRESRAFVLRIRKRDKRRILRPYLQHIHTASEEIEQRRKEVRLYSNVEFDDRNGRWRSVPFTHPATLDAIAMDAELKSKIKSDLEGFLKSKQYYHRIGRVWKRSYLLYGPSGTGKSSFVAAVAKFLSYDVYDVDLSKVSGDSDLKMLLLQTTTRSVILIEDLDKYLADRSTTPVTLTGVLNFMDGVVNSCCDERIMFFTMTTKDNIDPVLLRPGRVDVHIYFPLCDFNNFKTLVNNYLGVKDHKLFPQVEEMFLTGATLSPAEIGELMMANRNSPSRALRSVITALQTNKESRGSTKAGRRTVESAAKGSPNESGDSVSVGCHDGVKEFRRFYGLLRRKNGRNSDSFDLGA
ncbi:hypothetical protein Nepgr_024370 [Nepenthes gracilis]|uniref:AAA+ ATPase domain-containing protein n=1 Tax=Nepenthes gracilis TaxID=150966 RepID=A0AAD3XYJ2_NEPGR|nr:hypothetical protein Nepgr_024370 [Nepenthes gracilis]